MQILSYNCHIAVYDQTIGFLSHLNTETGDPLYEFGLDDTFDALSECIYILMNKGFSYQQIVAFLGLLVYKFYGEELREMFGYEEHPYGFYTLAVLAIVLVGLLYGFFIAIICGQKINERHYHVLAKQELTKV
jgi:hypothetical protein